MRRRTVLQSALGAAGLGSLPAWAQAAFPGNRDKELKELAAVVLPASLGRKATDAVADQFVRWVREYKPGAEMGPGYGNTRIRRTADSPAATYMAQLEQLQPVMTRAAIGEAIKKAGVRDLGQVPTGQHIASDLMMFYFQSPEANDMAYEAAVGKDQCRTIADSSQKPKARTRNAAL
jgi:hypothetical protein